MLPFLPHHNANQLVLLFSRFQLLYLVAVASAVTHDQFRIPGYPQWYGYGPLARSSHIQAEYPQDEATARYLVNFGAFQRVTGLFKEDSTQVPEHTVTGNVAFYQNPFTGVNSKYKMTIKGIPGGTDFTLMLQTDCLKSNHIGVVS